MCKISLASSDSELNDQKCTSPYFNSKCKNPLQNDVFELHLVPTTATAATTVCTNNPNDK